MPETVLAICAHPDDETLGCGGTLLRHRDHGDTLHWLIATRALTNRWTDADRARKDREIDRVTDALGFTRRFELGLPSAELDQVSADELIVGIASAVDAIAPSTVYVVHGGDVHTDHHALFTATMSVLKPFHMRQRGIRRIVSFETLSSTEAAPFRFGQQFVPNVFTDITPYMDQKLAIMALYESEAQPDPLPRGPSAIRSLARFRGATIGVDYAEAGMLIRQCEFLTEPARRPSAPSESIDRTAHRLECAAVGARQQA